MSDEKFCFAIDRGGTFTDIYAKCPGGKVRVMKLLSVDPENYDDAPREGIRRILEQVCVLFAYFESPYNIQCVTYIISNPNLYPGLVPGNWKINDE